MTTSGKAVGECLGEFLGEGLGTDLAPRANLPWSGIQPSDLVLALDAGLSNTITVETGVSLWADQSGKGNDVVQATTSKQPTLTTFNGLDVVSFDGVDDDLVNTSLSDMGAVGSSYTVFVVSKMDNISGKGMYEFTTTSDVVNTGMSAFHSGNLLQYRAFDGVAFSTALKGFTDTTNSHIFEMVQTTAQRSARVDGDTPATEATSRTLVALNQLYLGRIGGGVFDGDMQLHSILVWKTELSSGDATTVRERLATRWSVTLP